MHDCWLCLAEKIAIVEVRLKARQFMNGNLEIYGSWRYISKFHRFPSTDETDLMKFAARVFSVKFRVF